jgi:hypothetical protein
MSWDNDSVGFNVVAKNTPTNKETIQDFMDFCNKEVQGNYVLGLKLLLSYWSDKDKFNLVFQSLPKRIKDSNLLP